MSVEEARKNLQAYADCRDDLDARGWEQALDRLILEVEASFDCDQYDPGRGYEKSCSEMGSLPGCRSCQAREKLAADALDHPDALP